MMSWIREKENAVYSRVDRFFMEHADCGYTVEQELLTGDFGPYANLPEIKKKNRTAEYALLNAEKAALLAGDYQTEVLARCWEDVLFNQFHDILGGASIKDAYIDAGNALGRATQTANEIMHFGLQSITRKMHTVGENPRDAWNVVVWNLNGSDYEGYIEAEVQWAHEFDWYDKEIELEDVSGNRYPCQIILEKSVIPAFRSRFVFKDRIPSVGYKMYRVVQTGEPVEARKVNPYEIETDGFQIYFSEKTGLISSIYDKKAGRELCGQMLVPHCYYDDGDTWCFNIEGYARTEQQLALKEIKVTESGALRTTIKATYCFKDSFITMYYTFYQNEAYFDVRYRVNWNEKHYVLKLEATVLEEKHIASVPYGSVERNAVWADVPMSGWLKTDNFSVLADSIFAYNMQEHTLGLTVLRSSIYGDLRIKEIDYEEEYDIISQGISEGRIRIDFEKRDWKAAEAFLNPPVVIIEANHDGNLPAEDSFYKVSGEVLLSAIKGCEYDDSRIVRVFEYTGKKQEVTLHTPEVTMALTLEPFEIKTIKLEQGKVSECYMTEEKSC